MLEMRLIPCFRLCLPLTCCSFDFGRPPTPIGTPSSTTFGQFSFQTPKPESSFEDPRVTWDTANPHATSPSFSEFLPGSSFATPRAGSYLDGSKAALVSKDIEAQIAAHVRNLSPNHSLDTADVGKTGDSSINSTSRIGEKTFVENRIGSESAPLGLALDTGDLLQSSGSSLQTPPPSSTSESKRKSKWANDQKTKGQKANGARRKSVPSRVTRDEEVAMVFQDATSTKPSNLDFSEESTFPDLGPATAPAYPQHKVFWDPSQMGITDMDFQVDFNTAFESTPRQGLESFVSDHAGSFLDAPTTITAEELHSHPVVSMNSALPMSFELTSELAGDISARGSRIGFGVDPSLIHSSPSRIAKDLQDNASKKNLIQEDALQPYAYQLQQLKREQSLRGMGKTRRKQRPTTDSPAVKAALETLREDDVNHRVPRRSSPSSSSNRASSVSSRASPKRDVTPWALKAKKADVSARRSSLKTRNSSFSSRTLHARRTAVSLKIDASGRARTETRHIEDSESAPTGSEGRSNQSIDDSDSEMTEDDFIAPAESTRSPSLSANGSFLRQQVSSRFSASSTPFSHSHKSSATSVFTSTSHPEGISESSERANGRHPLSKQHDISDSVRRLRQLIPNQSRMDLDNEDDNDTNALMDCNETLGGTAQDELKKLLKSRKASAVTSTKTIRPTQRSHHDRASILYAPMKQVHDIQLG